MIKTEDFIINIMSDNINNENVLSNDGFWKIQNKLLLEA